MQVGDLIKKEDYSVKNPLVNWYYRGEVLCLERNNLHHRYW